MDQIKIGKFISEKRKDAGLTQMQLAERLGITDRAISKWECGRAMPDSSIMLELCRALKISVTDLLCGEVITMEGYDKKLEDNLMGMISEKERADRMLLSLEWIIGILSVIVLLVPIIIGALLPMEEWLRLIIVFSGFIPAIAGIMFAVKIEQVAGYYECRECGHRYVPTFKAASLSMHLGRTRHMKCPACGKRSWQKKVISKKK